MDKHLLALYKLSLCLFLCFFLLNGYCNIIKTTTADGKNKTYTVNAGYFTNENSATQLKFKLLSLFKQQVIIARSNDQKGYNVLIGPIQNAQLAQDIEHFLQPQKQNKPKYKKNISKLDKKIWNLHNVDIRTVIEEVANLTGKNFIIDPRVQGKISFVSGSYLNNKELYPAFLSMLQVAGYTAIQNGDIIKITTNIDARNEFSTQKTTNNDDILITIVHIKYVPAEQLSASLRQFMPQWSNIIAYQPSNDLILSGRTSIIKRIIEIIKQVDTSSNNSIDVIPLKHALAMDLITTLKELIKINTNNFMQTSIAIDDRSNAILLRGNRIERIRLRYLIAKLDNQSRYNNGNTQIIALHYLRAEDLVPILAGVAQANFSGTVGTTIGTITHPSIDSTNPASNFANQQESTPTAPKVVNQNATPNTTNSNTQENGSSKPTVQIIAEPNTNSLILNAPINIIRILTKVINELDIRPAQLIIEAIVAEINANDINSLGIEWGTVPYNDKNNTFHPGFAIINSQTNIKNFQAQLYALIHERKANVLSTPSVLVLDNRQAKILVGQQLSVATTTYPNNGNGTAIASPYSTFDRVNVALHLYVRPQITKDSGIQLEIDQGNDTIDPSSIINNDTTNPIFRISSIVTAVHVKSGDIIILGGLMQDSLATNNIKIPILGDIPGIGYLFQHNINNREKRVLMVFIKTMILQNKSNASQVSMHQYNQIRHNQLQWLRTQDFIQNNQETILPAQTTTNLPKPFN